MVLRHPNVILAIAASLAVALSGCGGGGGSSMDMDSDNMPIDEMSDSNGMDHPQDGMPVAVADLSEIQLYGDLAEYGAVAGNSPAFGSITQSSNGNGISTDRVETTIDANGELNVVVRDGNGHVSLELNSRDHESDNLNGTAWMDDSAVDFPQDWSGNGWILSKQVGDEIVVALAYTAWEDTDITNYLAGGYWIKGSESGGVEEMGTFGDAGAGSVFAYYDDPASSWNKRVTGTASYLGAAEGAYVGSDGDAGVWWSRLKLDADFATSTISGCVGCLEADPMRDDRGIYILHERRRSEG